jgi:hypothetical protein
VWKTFLDAALSGQPNMPWPSPDAAEPRRLLVDGLECSTGSTRTDGGIVVAPVDADVTDC